MADDIVQSIVKKSLVECGFHKTERMKFSMDLFETVVTIELQNNSFNKLQHFLNLTVEFSDSAMRSYELNEIFALWTRVESLVPLRRPKYQGALDASNNLSLDERSDLLRELFFSELKYFLKKFSTYTGIESLYKEGGLGLASVAVQLKRRWDH